MARTGRPRGKAAREETRTCLGCGRTMPLALHYFAHHSSCRGGFHARCRECVLLGKKADRGDWEESWPVQWWEARAVRQAMARPALKTGQRCEVCCGLSHRRPESGCPRCSAPYAPLPPLELVTHRSYEPAVAV